MKKRFFSAASAVMAAVLLLTLACVPVTAAAENVDASCVSVNLHVASEDEFFNARFSADALSAVVALAVDANIQGYKQTYEMDGVIFAGADGIALSSRAFLDQVYGVDLTRISENLPNSVLHPDSGTYFALDWEDYTAIEQVFAPTEEKNPFGNLLSRYAAILAGAIEGRIQNSVGFETVTVGSSEVRTLARTFTLDSDAIAGIVAELAAEAAWDQELKELVAVLLELNHAAYGTNMTAMEFADSIWSQWDDRTAEVLSVIQQAAPSASFRTYTRGTTLVAAELVITVEDSPLRVLLTLDSENMGFSLIISGDGEELFSVAFKNSRNGYTLTANQEGRPVLRAYLTFNQGGYMLTLVNERYYRDRMVMTGRIIEEEDSLTITADNINGEDDYQLSLTFRVDEERISIPDYIDLLTLSEEEAEILAIYVYNSVENIDF